MPPGRKHGLPENHFNCGITGPIVRGEFVALWGIGQAECEHPLPRPPHRWATGPGKPPRAGRSKGTTQGPYSSGVPPRQQWRLRMPLYEARRERHRSVALVAESGIVASELGEETDLIAPIARWTEIVSARDTAHLRRSAVMRKGLLRALVQAAGAAWSWQAIVFGPTALENLAILQLDGDRQGRVSAPRGVRNETVRGRGRRLRAWPPGARR